MAIYKVPQDVEAEDKLLGPFTFRQFLYLIVVAVMGFMAVNLWKITPPLAFVTLPFIALFLALALPLRKEQSMEVYLAALLSFVIKPKVRLWDPDGIETRVEVSAPKVVEVSLAKDISQEEVERRFAYLAQIIDTKGWATRSVNSHQNVNSNMINPDVYYESLETEDILDEDNIIGQNINQRLETNSQNYKQNIINSMQQTHESFQNPNYTPELSVTNNNMNTVSQYQETPQQIPYIEPQYQTQYQNINQQPYIEPQYQSTNNTTLNTTINQQYADNNYTGPTPVINSTSEDHQESGNRIDNPEEGDKKNVSPAIIELATNAPEDFSIATLANQAKRISEKDNHPLEEEEVVISLR